ncbi:hypothetical protein GBA52_007220 [Prunus armeniaca]|nr:hypothetical protein GBA52_007220 [Prunus armeniaca]
MWPIFIPRTPATSNTNNIDQTTTATNIIINQNPSNSSSNPPIIYPLQLSPNLLKSHPLFCPTYLLLKTNILHPLLD